MYTISVNNEVCYMVEDIPNEVISFSIENNV